MFTVKILMLYFLHFVDLICFFILYEIAGIEFEINPFAVTVFNSFGKIGIILLKVWGIGVFIFIVVSKRKEKGVKFILDAFLAISLIVALLSLIAIWRIH